MGSGRKGNIFDDCIRMTFSSPYFKATPHSLNAKRKALNICERLISNTNTKYLLGQCHSSADDSWVAHASCRRRILHSSLHLCQWTRYNSCMTNENTLSCSQHPHQHWDDFHSTSLAHAYHNAALARSSQAFVFPLLLRICTSCLQDYCHTWHFPLSWSNRKIGSDPRN